MNSIYSALGSLINLVYPLLSNITLLIMAIIGIGFLIAFHELGHFLFCKLFKVSTPSFSIGFGPRLLEKKIGDTTFALSAIPLGGYVEIAGSHEPGQGDQKEAFRADQYSFTNKPYYQKMLIIAGGILFNLIFAWAALSALFYFGGPCLGTWCNTQLPALTSIKENSSASRAGLQPYDVIKSINNTPVNTIKEASQLLSENIGNTVPITLERNNSLKETQLSIEFKTVNNKKAVTLGAFWYILPQPFLLSLKSGLNATVAIIKEIFSALTSIFTQGATDNIGGPLMLISQVTQSAGMGFKVFLLILALISVNLAVFNVLPFPIFDGGQALFTTIETLKGKPLSDQTREKIAYYTWLAVIILVIYLTYKDILKFVGY